MPTNKLRVSLLCSVCGSGLYPVTAQDTTDETGIQRVKVIRIKPCETCIQAAKTEKHKLDSYDLSNEEASRLGQIALEVGLLNSTVAGDSIDRGLILRRRLSETGFEVRRAEPLAIYRPN